MLCKGIAMKFLVILTSMLFSFLSANACAQKEKTIPIKKKPASYISCDPCNEFTDKAQVVLSQLSKMERKFDPSNYKLMIKQAKVRKELANHINHFLSETSISEPGVLDAVLTVWMMGVDYERQAEIAEINFKHFRPVLEEMYSQIAFRIASAKTEDKKRRLNKIRDGLIGTEGVANGDPQDSRYGP